LSSRYSHSTTFNKAELVKSTTRNVLSIVSFLEVARLSGMISEMNFSILCSEFEKLLEVLDSLDRSVAKQDELVLSRSYFDVSEQLKVSSEQEKTSLVGQKRREPVNNNEVKKMVDSSKGQITADRVSPVTVKRQNTVHSSIADLSDKKDLRKGVILGILKRLTSITVKDVSAVVSDCSEKTLQRELQSLVDRGVLNKVGTRRWTRYSLPTAV